MTCLVGMSVLPAFTVAAVAVARAAARRVVAATCLNLIRRINPLFDRRPSRDAVAFLCEPPRPSELLAPSAEVKIGKVRGGKLLPHGGDQVFQADP